MVDIDECVNHPCAYGARCVDRIGTYECICPEGRSGRHCEEVIAPVAPKPASCRFNHRIYDHGEKWSSHCATCECVEGEIVCKREFCGYWSCLSAGGDDFPVACVEGDECRLLSAAPPPSLCLTPPCYARAPATRELGASTRRRPRASSSHHPLDCHQPSLVVDPPPPA